MLITSVLSLVLGEGSYPSNHVLQHHVAHVGSRKTADQSPLPLPAADNGDAEGNVTGVELLLAPPGQENKQKPGTLHGQLCQTHQMLLHFSPHLARSQQRSM